MSDSKAPANTVETDVEDGAASMDNNNDDASLASKIQNAVAAYDTIKDFVESNFSNPKAQDKMMGWIYFLVNNANTMYDFEVFQEEAKVMHFRISSPDEFQAHQDEHSDEHYQFDEWLDNIRLIVTHIELGYKFGSDNTLHSNVIHVETLLENMWCWKPKRRPTSSKRLSLHPRSRRLPRRYSCSDLQPQAPCGGKKTTP